MRLKMQLNNDDPWNKTLKKNMPKIVFKLLICLYISLTKISCDKCTSSLNLFKFSAKNIVIIFWFKNYYAIY